MNLCEMIFTIKKLRKEMVLIQLDYTEFGKFMQISSDDNKKKGLKFTIISKHFGLVAGWQKIFNVIFRNERKRGIFRRSASDVEFCGGRLVN